MYMKYAQGGKVNYPFSTYIVDEESEIATIPGVFGDKAYVIHTGESWMLDSAGKWYPFNGDKDPIECDCVEESTIWNDLPQV